MMLSSACLILQLAKEKYLLLESNRVYIPARRSINTDSHTVHNLCYSLIENQRKRDREVEQREPFRTQRKWQNLDRVPVAQRVWHQ